MNNKIRYEFLSKMWKHNSTGAWYFVSLPKNLSNEIRKNLKWQEEGWGRMKVTSQLNELSWETAIWFDSKTDTYLLPIKAEIRKKGNLTINTHLKINIWL